MLFMPTYLYHYSKVRYDTLLSRELQLPTLTEVEREKGIKDAKEVWAPGPYFKHISFFTEEVPFEILGTIFGKEHHAWYPGAKLFEYKIDISTLSSFTFRLAESELCQEMLSATKYANLPDGDWFELRYRRQVKAGEIGTTLSQLKKVILDNQGKTRQAYLKIRSQPNWEQIKMKYAASVPHLMVYFERGELSVKEVRRVTVGHEPLPISANEGITVLIQENVDDVSFDSLMRRMVVESNVGADVLTLFKRIVPKSVEVITSFLPNLTQLSEKSVETPLSSSLYKDVLRKSQGFNFLVYDATLIQVPEGFNGKLVNYLTLLILHTEKEIKEGKSILDNYNIELSMFLSNADVRQSMKSHTDFYKKIRKDRDDWAKDIAKFYDTRNPTLSRRPVGQVIERFSDMERVFALTEKLAQLRTQLNYKLIVAEINKTTGMLELIRSRMATEDIGSASPQMAKNLSEGAYEVAKFVEVMSIHGYYVETAISSVNSMAEQLALLFKDK